MRCGNILLVWALMFQVCWAQQNYVRLVRDATKNPTKLQTAIARFESPDGAIVDLVSVIHIADKSYYEKLNKHLGHYDSVLYEMVLDVPRSFAHQNEVREILGKDKKEPRIDTTRGGRDSLSLFQKQMAGILGLEFQQDIVRYNQDNFRHADLTLEEFDKAMSSEHKSPSDLLTTLFEKSTAPGPEVAEISKLPLLKIFAVGPNDAERRTLKIGMGAILSSSIDPATEIQGDVLIGQRNAKAMAVLQERVSKKDKKIAIFYGAAHMPDFSLRLRKLGFKPVYRNWVTAWTI